jgi:hypothetical protein
MLDGIPDHLTVVLQGCDCEEDMAGLIVEPKHYEGTVVFIRTDRTGWIEGVEVRP